MWFDYVSWVSSQCPFKKYGIDGKDINMYGMILRIYPWYSLTGCVWTFDEDIQYMGEHALIIGYVWGWHGKWWYICIYIYIQIIRYNIYIHLYIYMYIIYYVVHMAEL